LAVRYGGEEFAILLPDTDIINGASIAEKIKNEVDLLNIPHEDSEISNQVSVSMGVASVIPENDMQPTDLVKLADMALYDAKGNGRNRIEIHS
jgi:diguanylate cyclase (GGDEF)-like protein